MENFNTYCKEVDLSLCYDLLISKGVLQTYKKGDYLISTHQCCNFIGLVKSGYFKYSVSGTDGEEHITGFAFQNSIVGDYFSLIKDQMPLTNIIATTDSEVFLCNKDVLKEFLVNNPIQHLNISNALFYQVYTQFLDLHRLSPQERYLSILAKCPDILQTITLKEMASFLNITPTHLSRLRKEITFNK